jgi:hypothetical protein
MSPTTSVFLPSVVEILNGFQARSGISPDPSSAYRIIQGRDVAGEVNWETVVHFKPERDASRFIVQDGDVVLPNRGGRPSSAVLRSVPPLTVATGSFFVLRPREGALLPEYLAWYLNQQPAQEYLQSRIRGTYIAMFSKADLEEMKIPVPPMRIQETIGRLAALRRHEQELIRQVEAKRDALLQAICLRAIDHRHFEEER